VVEPAGADRASTRVAPARRWAQHRTVQVTAAVLVSVGMVAAVAAATVRAAVLRTQFFGAVADRTNTVERIYDDVLVDPDLVRLRTDLAAGQARAVRTAAAGVGVNIRLALPPDTLRALLADQVDALVSWLRGDTDTLRLEVSLGPIVDNLRGLAASYLSEVLEATPTLRTDTLPALRAQLGAALADVRAGRPPAALPSLAGLGGDDAKVAAELLSFVPPQLRTSLRPLLDADLRAGDGADALALVLGPAVALSAAAAGRDLLDLAGDARVSFAPLVADAVPPGTADTVRTVRWWLGTPLVVILAVSVLVALLGLTVLVLGAPESPRRGARRGAIALAVGALLSAVLAIVAWLWLGWLVEDVRRRHWPSSVRALVVDNANGARSEILRTWLRFAAMVLLIGIAIVLAEVVARTWRRGGRTVPNPRGRTVALVAALGFVAVGVALVPAADRVEQRCNGATYLCDRRYDEVVALATHNAMANTEDRFLFPLQDPDIDTQLDAGARAMQLDSWTWETPDQVAGRLATADLPARAVDAVRRLVAVANPPRPGTWLCHNVCRLGALPIVGTFVALRDWLDRNPREVVTIIVQDETPAANTVAAVRASGLVPYLAVPPSDPHGSWPTLGEMIVSGHRLVLFTENAKNAAPWLQNFYEYGEETPFSFASPDAMTGPSSCVPHRGGTERTLFLLNHFVTPASGSRKASAQANSAEFLRQRIKDCEAVRHKLPTIIAVDFASLGQAQVVVDQLNRTGVGGS
jgi:hypothetical protein